MHLERAKIGYGEFINEIFFFLVLECLAYFQISEIERLLSGFWRCNHEGHKDVQRAGAPLL